MAEPTDQQIAKREARPLAAPGFAFLPRTWEELYAYAKEIASTEFVPKAMTGKPGAVLAAWQKGQEVGLPPMAALESIAIINGRPTIHSDGYWGLIINHQQCEWFTETPPDEALKQGFGECSIKRRGNPHPIVRRFTVEMAKAADLLDKDNWKKYRGRMLQQRARHLAGNDAIPEATQGLVPREMAMDDEPRDVTPAKDPIKIPQPIKEKANEPIEPAQPGSAASGPGANAERSPDASPKPAEASGQVHEEAAQPKETQATAPDSSSKPVEEPTKSVKQVALEEIAGFSKDTFPTPDWLNPYMKDVKGKDQAELCAAYNAKKLELGL